MSGKSKLAFGALIGAAVGMVAGILTAPKSGKDTRAEIMAKADDLKNDVSFKADDVKSKASEVASKAEDSMRGVIDNAKSGFKNE